MLHFLGRRSASERRQCVGDGGSECSIRLELTITLEWHRYFCITGFVFYLSIDFTPEYNLVPPVVKFLTIPFHPNGKN